VVRTTTVTSEPLARTITVTGTLAAEEQVSLAFMVPGRIDRVAVDLGYRVHRGEVVATIAATDFELRVQQAEAALLQARARLGLAPGGTDDTVDPENTALVRQRRAVSREARLNRDRAQTFVTRGLSPQAALDAAEASLEVAEGQYQDALEEIGSRHAVLAQRRSELEIARQQLRDTVLQSPLDGAVRERRASEGEYTAAGTPVLTVVRTHPLRLQLAVPERALTGLSTGLPVHVRVENDSRVKIGRLERIGAAIAEESRTLPVEASVPNSDNALRPGQFATAEIVLDAGAPTLVMPEDALVTFAGVQKVLTVEDGHAREHRVRTGRRDGDRVEILEGLSRGDRVILSPGDLVDGAPVQAERAE
jgi:RND family efflux transporter MFP subunit